MRPRPATSPPKPLPWWPGFFIEHPWIMGVIGVLLAAGMVPLFFTALADYRSYPDRPTPATIEEAIQAVESGGRRWVTISDVPWRCDHSLQEGRVIVLATQRDRQFVVELGRDDRCADLSEGPMTGVLSVARDKRRRWLTEREGLKLTPRDEPLLLLCTYCGGDNARLGLYMAPALTILGLGIYPLFKRLRRHYYGY